MEFISVISQKSSLTASTGAYKDLTSEEIFDIFINKLKGTDTNEFFLPEAIDSNGGSKRFFWYPFPVFNSDRRHHLSWRTFIPIKTHICEINKKRLITKIGNSFSRKQLVRKAIESSGIIKFRNGNRGFYQGFLKHLAPAPVNHSAGREYLRKNGGGKIDKPVIYLNPTMKWHFSVLGVCIYFICKDKNNFIHIIKIIGRHPDFRVCA